MSTARLELVLSAAVGTTVYRVEEGLRVANAIKELIGERAITQKQSQFDHNDHARAKAGRTGENC